MPLSIFVLRLANDVNKILVAFDVENSAKFSDQLFVGNLVRTDDSQPQTALSQMPTKFWLPTT